MFRFDDKRRRRLLEDALVADLLDASSAEQSAPQDEEVSGRVPVTNTAATRPDAVRAHKSKA